MDVCEEWKNIRGYEGLYQISNFGRVKSLPKINRKFERVLNCNINNCGYVRVKLCRHGDNKWVSVHRLVALYFIDNTSDKCCVNHIDGNKLNNHVSNLEWVTVSENTKHAFDTGLAKCKLSRDDVLVIRMLHGMFTTTVLAMLYGVSQTHVGYIINYDKRGDI